MNNAIRSVAGMCLAMAAFLAIPTISSSQTIRVGILYLMDPTTGRSVSLNVGASTAAQTVALPPTLPSVGHGVRATAVAGSDVTTAWESVGTGGGGGGGGGSSSEINSTTSSVNLASTNQAILTVTLDANVTYRVQGLLVALTGNNATDMILSWATLPAGATSTNLIVNTVSGASSTTTNTDETTILCPNNNTSYPVVISGAIIMGGTSGTVTLQARKTGAGASVINAGGFLSFIP